MTIQAQSADGVIHEFPDGTADAVIDKAMKSYASEAKPQEAPKRGFVETIAHNLAHPIEAWKERVKAIADEQRKTNAELEVSREKGDKFPQSATLEKSSREAAMGFVAPSGGNSLARFADASVPKAIPAAQAANQAGYVLPPQMATESPGMVRNLLSGWSGKIKLAQEASARNQHVTTKIATQDLGLPEGKMLNEQAFNEVRAKAGQSYKAVTDSGVKIHQDMGFIDDLLKLGPDSAEMAKYFPETAKNGLIKDLQDEFGTGEAFSPKAGIQAVRRLRAKATANLKSFDNPDKVELGKAQKGAADAIEDLIERNLKKAGKPDLLKSYRDARQMIAKSYDVEAATNTATGDVSASALARQARKGRPLTGGLKTIADTATAFPKAVQDTAKFGGNEKFSALDAFAAAHAMAMGRPEVLGMVLGRPIARQLALSKLMQNSLARVRPNMSAASPANSLARIMLPSQAMGAPQRPTFGAPIPSAASVPLGPGLQALGQSP